MAERGSAKCKLIDTGERLLVSIYDVCRTKTGPPQALALPAIVQVNDKSTK